MKMRIAADKFEKRQAMNEYSFEEIPVDMYGRRIFPSKSNPNNLQNAAEDIREYYGLTGKDGLKGGE